MLSHTTISYNILTFLFCGTTDHTNILILYRLSHNFGVLLSIPLFYSERVHVCVSTHVYAYVYIHVCTWYSTFLPTQLKSLTNWTTGSSISFFLSFSTSKLHCGGWTFFMNIHPIQLSSGWTALHVLIPPPNTLEWMLSLLSVRRELISPTWFIGWCWNY